MNLDLFETGDESEADPMVRFLEAYDRETFQSRLKRFRWYEEINPKGGAWMMPSDTYLVFNEIKLAFVQGAYISTIVLSAGFAEHVLAGALTEMGYEKEARGGLKSIVALLKKNGLSKLFVLQKIDRIREIRNPFVHLKPFSHPHNLTQRMLQIKNWNQEEMLEKDAKEAISIALHIGMTGLG